MDAIADVQALEADVTDCGKKSKQVNCGAIFDAIIASLKLLYDFVFFGFSTNLNLTIKSSFVA